MMNKRDSVMYNADGYFDPTAGMALRNVEKSLPGCYVRWPGQPVYICTAKPVTSEKGIRYLERCCIFAAEQGAHPIAPMLFYAGICDISDVSARCKIMKWTRKWLRQASEIWVFDGEPPRNFKTDIERFVRKGKTIRYFSSDDKGNFTQNRAVTCESERE